MADLAELTIRVRSLEVKQAEVNLDRLGQSAGRAEGATEHLTSMFNKLLAVLTAAGGAMAFGALQAVKLSASFEQTELAFTTLLGSAEKAKAFVKEMLEISKVTPFQFAGLADSVRLMLAMGFAAKDTLPMLLTLGDAVAALGKSEEEMKRMVLALGQMQMKGKVSAQEMNQLAEAGIGAWKYLADAIGKDIPTAMKLAESGAIQSGMAVKAILQGIADDPKFKGAMEKQSKTLAGLWSTFKDSLDLALKDIGDNLVQIFDIKGNISDLTTALDSIGHVVVDVVRIFADLPPKFEETAQTAQKVVDVLRMVGAGIAGLLAIGITAYLVQATIAMWNFTAACLANPILAIPTVITAGIGGLVTALILFRNESVKAGDETVTVTDIIVGAWDRTIRGLTDMIDFFRDLIAAITEVKQRFDDVNDSILKFIGFGDVKSGMSDAFVNSIPGMKEARWVTDQLLADAKEAKRTRMLAEVGPLPSLNMTPDKDWGLPPGMAGPPNLPPIAGPSRASVPFSLGTNKTQEANMNRMFDDLQDRLEAATGNSFSEERVKVMAKFRKANSDVFETQQQLNDETERYAKLLDQVQAAEAQQDVGKTILEIQQETESLKANADTREFLNILFKEQNNLTAAGLVDQSKSEELTRRLGKAWTDFTTARGDEALREMNKALSDQATILGVAEPLREREAFRLKTLADLTKEYGWNVDKATEALKKLMAAYDAVNASAADDQVRKRIEDMRREGEILDTSVSLRDRQQFILDTEKDLLREYAGNAELAAAALTKLTEAYDALQVKKGNSLLREQLKGFDREISTASMGPEAQDRARFILEKQEEMMAAYAGDTQLAADAMTQLVAKYDELASRNKLQSFVNTFSTNLQNGIEDALYNAIMGGDWQEALSQTLMMLAKDSFHEAFSALTATKNGDGGSSNVFLDILGTVFSGIVGGGGDAGGGSIAAADAGYSDFYYDAAGGTYSPAKRSMKMPDITVNAFMAPDEATADAYAAKQTERGSRNVVMKGSGTPGVSSGTLKARRKN